MPKSALIALFAAATAMGLTVSHAADLKLEAVDITEMKAVYGQIQPRNSVLARTRLGGTLVELNVTEGDIVKAGDVIAEVKDDKIEPPIKVLPLPIKKDDMWKVESKLGTQSIKGNLKIVNDKEKIKVQGTEYETVLIEGKDVDVAGAKTTLRIWLAKDRGIVKEEFLLQGGETLLLELKNYSAK